MIRLDRDLDGIGQVGRGYASGKRSGKLRRCCQWTEGAQHFGRVRHLCCQSVIIGLNDNAITSECVVGGRCRAATGSLRQGHAAVTPIINIPITVSN